MTKLYRPRMRGDLVGRPRLLALLDTGLDRKLTLVSTPPGYGKSTLVSQWLTASNHPSAWITLDENDNELNAFFRYVVAAIQTIDSGLCTETARLLDNLVDHPVRTIVASLINELAAVDRRFTLVLDDYHTLSAPAIHEGLITLLTHGPPMLRMVITTRSDPPFALLRMRASGELLELRATDLSFLSEEMNVLLTERHGLSLSISELESLQTWSEGWPVGLMLVGRMLQGQPATNIKAFIQSLSQNIRLVEDYLWSEVLQPLPAEWQRFLMETSVMGQFNVNACEAVTGSDHAEQMLNAIDKENLFLIELEGEGGWYRYHQLFSSVLRDRLIRESSLESVQELHRRAALWHQATGAMDEAARHAIAAGAWDLVLEILKPLCAELYDQERLSILRDWIQQLPEEVIGQDADLCYWLAWAEVRAGNITRSRVLVAKAEALWSLAGNAQGIGKALQISILEDVFLQRVDIGLERSEQALKFLHRDDAAERIRIRIMRGILYECSGNLDSAEHELIQARTLSQRRGFRPIQFVEENAFGTLLLQRGKFREAATIFRRVITTADESRDLAALHSLWLLASVHLEWNEPEIAEPLLTRAIQLADLMQAPLHLTQIHQGLAELAWMKGDAETARAEIDRAIEFCIMVGATPYLWNARAFLANIWLDKGQLSLARSWATESNLDPLIQPEYPHFPGYLILLRLMSLEGQNDLVLSLLEPLELSAVRDGRMHDLLKVLVLRTIAEDEVGKPAESAQSLERALEIGAPEGFIRTFLNAGPQILRPLEEAARREGASGDFARKLLAAARGEATPTAAARVPAGLMLSPRETEILHMVAAGYSNQAIADQLFISHQTVKKHLSNVFQKLSVSSRTQAIERGRRLGLL
jgi:LuxR family maltose regulon positive regulatory protein